MLGKFKVIDTHCHIYPQKIASAAVSATSRFYCKDATYNGTYEQLEELCKLNGVDKALVHSAATTPVQVGKINSFISKTVDQHKNLLVGLGTLHPDSEDIIGDVKNLKALGLAGVKLHPDIQGFKVDDYRMLKIYEACEKEKIPILMHTGDKRYDNSNPNRLIPIIETYKNLTIIGAHLGGWSVWEQASEKLCGYQNFYVDTSSCITFGGEERIRKIITKYSPDRILFGSDYPLGCQKQELDFIMSIGYSDSQLEKIFSLNACKVFKIDKASL